MATAYRFPDEDDAAGAQAGSELAGEIEIEIVDDTPERDKGRVPLDRSVEDPSEDELKTYSDSVQRRIKDLTHARHDERRSKEAALRQQEELGRMTSALLEENNRLKQYVNVGEQHYAATLNTAATLEVENARKKLKEAHESFDTDAIIAAQEELSDARMRLNNAQNFKPSALQPVQNTVQTADTAPKAPELDDKTLRWQAKNQWFGADGYEELTSFSLGLHQKLVKSGVDPRSDEYFEKIDARMRATFPEVFGESRRESQSGESSTSRRPASVVASGSRTTGARRIQLTATQVALAKKYNLTPQQYAAEVLKLENQNG